MITDPNITNDVLRQYVEAIGSDGYAAIFSLGEIDPMFGGQQDLVAYSDTLGQLGPDGEDGFARMVVPGDTAGGRYISNLVALKVFTAAPVPEPATWVLMIAAPSILMFLRSRRRTFAREQTADQSKRHLAAIALALGPRQRIKGRP